MTLEEYAVEKIKGLENKQTELETALKSKEAQYKNSNAIIKKLREEIELMKEMIGYLGSNDVNTRLTRGGTIYMYLHDPYDKYEEDLSAEEKIRRKWFTFCVEIIKAYKEEHPEPEPEPEESTETKEEGDEPF